MPRTQNQTLHEEAIALILQTKQKRSEASVFEKAKQTREEYNKRRTEATDKLRTVLTKIWEAFDCGESVGIFATRKAWCKDQKVTMRWCQKVIAGPQSNEANTHKSVRVDFGQQVIFRDGIYTVGLDGDGKAAFIPVALHVPIVHVNDDQPYDLYIGRKHNRNGESLPASIWGNHDRLPLHEFEKQVRSNPELMAKLPELKGKVLGCWHRIEDYCECHGSVLLKLVAELGDDQPTPPIPTVKSYADGAVTVQANFYNEEEVKALFDDCAKLNFVRGKVRGRERRHAVRIFCDVETAVRRKEARSPLSEAPDEVKKLLVDLSKHSGENVNYAAVVEYRDGDDYIASHQHNEDRGNDATVWIVSAGAERPFVVKPIDGGAATEFLATQGSLITLSSEANKTHFHSVPKCKGCTAVRYSVNCKAIPLDPVGATDETAESLKNSNKGISLYDPNFIPPADADRLFAGLNQLRWRQHVIPMWGKDIPAPRLYDWQGIPPQPRADSHGGFKDEGGIYAGETFKSSEWTPEALEIRQRIQDKLGILYDSLNINKYRNGEDHVGFHIDKDDEGSWDYPIASVSLGVVRDFQYQPYILGGKSGRKRIPAGEIVTIALAHGSLVVMPAGSQAFYQHRLKRQPKVVGERINLTFRMMDL
ncbi:MAG: alpha-ketoglutarate-dependent dioxygenase AlkB [Candidatus Sulfotelmatobacter sp.]